MSSSSASPSAARKRHRLSSSSPPTSPVTETTKREDMGYVLFESLSYGYAEYVIYKLGPDSDSIEKQQPIWYMKEAETLPELLPAMAVFSSDRKLYFVGGMLVRPRKRTAFSVDAYVLDITSLLDHSGTSTPPVFKAIKSMNKPKPDPLAFGPFGADKDKFYVITSSLVESVCSFEMYDASANEWTFVTPPSYDLFDGVCDDLKKKFLYNCDRSTSATARLLTIKSWAVHDSYICVSTPAAVFAYSTEFDRWDILGSLHSTNELAGPVKYLPFPGPAYPLSFPNRNVNENIFVAMQSYYPRCIAQVFRSPHWPSVNEFKPPAIFFPPSGEVECLSDHLDELPTPSYERTGVFTFNSEPRLCIVRGSLDTESLMRSYMIHVCDLIMTEGAKVKATNTASYKFLADHRARPRHFFFAA